jgi:hypothetical protein
MFSEANKVISKHSGVQVHENALGQKSLFANRGFKNGEVILPFSAACEQDYPTYLTVQISDNVHIMLSPGFLQYANHSCSPNAFFDTMLMQFIALENISEGDELAFFYPSTEWDMAQPFACECGSLNCLQIIKGAAYLSEEQINQHRFTAYIAGKLSANK